MLEFFLFQVFLDVFKIFFEKKLFLWDVQIHLVNIYRSYHFFVVFSDPEQSSNSYQKKMCAVGSLPPQNQSKLVNQTGRNHCGLSNLYQT